MRIPYRLLLLFFLGGTILSCGQEEKTFPVIGPTTLEANGDTTYHQIAGFTFIDQKGAPFTQEAVRGNIYVADFFFTRCPDICPQMSRALLRVETATEDMEDVLLLSHSLDPLYDTPEQLQLYIDDLGAKADRWYFLTTDDEDYVYDVMIDQYLLSGSPTGALNGGIFHTGKLVLVDDKGYIRGYYDGLDPLDVDRLIEDIPILLAQVKIRTSS